MSTSPGGRSAPTHESAGTPEPANRVAIYARVSSDQQAQAGTIASQVAALEQRVAQDGLALDPEMRFLDEGFSGSTLLRPALERLRDMAAAGAIDRLYVHCPDRLARSYAYQVLLVEELRRCNVQLVFVNHELGRSPEDDLLLQMQGMMAEYERAKIMERSRRGKLHAARRGCVSALACAPYGYRYLSKEHGGGQAQFNIHLEEAGVTRQIFHWVGVERLSIGEVCRRLEKQGIASPKGNPRWDRSTVWGILRNPAYKGEAVFGKTRAGERQPRLRASRGQPQVPRRHRAMHPTPAEQQVSIPVPPLVDEALFAAVSEQLEENRLRQRQARGGASYLLQGLTVCAICGYACCGKPASKRSRRRYAYYRCCGTDAYRFGGQRVCVNKPVATRVLDQAVWDDVADLLRDPQRIEREYQRRLEGEDQGQAAQEKQKLATSIQQTQRGIARLIDAYGEGVLEKQEFEPRIRTAKERLSKLQSELDCQEQLEASREEMRLVIGRLETFASQVKEGLAQTDWKVRRDIIRMVVRRVEVDREQVRVIYRVSQGPFAEAPSRGILQDCWRRGNVATGGAQPGTPGKAEPVEEVASTRLAPAGAKERRLTTGLQGRITGKRQSLARDYWWMDGITSCDFKMRPSRVGNVQGCKL
jgi:site-specific DNA recombinase